MDVYEKENKTNVYKTKNKTMTTSTIKQSILQEFKKFVQPYGLNDPRVQLKYHHSIRVAKLAQRIARDSDYDEHAAFLAWLAGLLHDVGRFEQLRQYDTFDDQVFPHAYLSVELLDNQHLIDEFTNDLDVTGFENTNDLDATDFESTDDLGMADFENINDLNLTDFEKELIIDAIRSHSAAQVSVSPMLQFPEDYPYAPTWLHHVLRDADKIDILAYVPDHMDICCGMPWEYLRTDTFNNELLSHLEKKEPIDTNLMDKGVDYLARYVSFSYQLIYPISRQILKEQGDIYRMLDFKSSNPETMQSFEQLKEFVDREISVKPDSKPVPVMDQYGKITELYLNPRDLQV